jgi:7-carboxy-7-deazaguanine synthase
MKTYHVKEMYHTLQGEGAHAGRAAVFLRFAVCNLWTGKEEDRANAICKFCDTDFVGTDGENGGRFQGPDLLANAVGELWLQGTQRGLNAVPYVVCTGGEPLLQVDRELVHALKQRQFEVAVETNGTVVAPSNIDWVCVSPKSIAPLRQDRGNELKLVFPQDDAMPDRFQHLDFAHFWLQPMDGPNVERNTKEAVDYCLKHPQWRLSLQTHKYLKIK